MESARGRPQGAPLRGDAAGVHLAHIEWHSPMSMLPDFAELDWRRVEAVCGRVVRAVFLPALRLLWSASSRLHRQLERLFGVPFRFLKVQGSVKRQSGQPTRAERYGNGRRGSRQITGDRITCEFDPVEGRLFLLDIFDQRHTGGGRFLFVRHHHAGDFWIGIIETPASPLCA